MQKPCEQTEEQRNVKLPLKASGSKKSATHHDPFISNPPTFIFPSTKEKPEGYSKLRWFFETLVHHPLSLLALWIKSLSFASTPCLLLACHAASSTSLDWVTVSFSAATPTCEHKLSALNSSQLLSHSPGGQHFSGSG